MQLKNNRHHIIKYHSSSYQSNSVQDSVKQDKMTGWMVDNSEWREIMT